MSRKRTTVARSVWHVDCPACGAEIDTHSTDAGAYDAIEVVVDCPKCNAEVHTETVVLVVAALTPQAAEDRAARIRGGASTSAEVRRLIAERTGA